MYKRWDGASIVVNGIRGEFGSAFEGKSSPISGNLGLPKVCRGEACCEGLFCDCCGVEGYAPERPRGVLMAQYELCRKLVA